MSEGENAQDCNTGQGIRAYHRIFQYFLSKRVNDHDWIYLATNGKWPVNTSQKTAGETAEILTMILVEFGGTPMTTAASTSRKIRRFTHADKAREGKSAELCDFRHLYALSLVDSIVGQMSDILSNAKANSNWLYPLPLFTASFDPRDAANYPVRVSSFDAFAVQYYASLIPLNSPIPP